jgi:acetoin utilization protein AcuB
LFAAQLIDASVPVLRESQVIADALEQMAEAYLRTLPIVSAEGRFLGLVDESELLEAPDDSIALSEIMLKTATLHNDSHLFDILKQFSHSRSVLLPVVDDEGLYMGCVTFETIIQHLSNDSSVNNPGGIIVLEMKAVNYSMAEIARIVESNHAVILHSYITPTADVERILVTLKLNKVDLKEVLLTFERFEYNIVAVFHVSEYEQGLQDRYESLMMYLSV